MNANQHKMEPLTVCVKMVFPANENLNIIALRKILQKGGTDGVDTFLERLSAKTSTGTEDATLDGCPATSDAGTVELAITGFLCCATEMGQLDIMKFLVETKGADVNSELYRVKSGWDFPVDLAAAKGHVECLKYLIEKGAHLSSREVEMKHDPLTKAVQSGQVECVKLLVEAGADVNPVRRRGPTPLMAALEAKQVECVKLLIANGADVNPIRAAGDLPLLTAVLSGQEECVKLLLEAGADVNPDPDRTYPPLIAAAENRQSACVKLLLRAGAHVNQTHGEFKLFLSF